ncbi:MAG: DUF4931 domain-containing protein, partial [Planctomycetota bacterium]
MPELRIDPIVGRKTLVAEDRAGRPFDFTARRTPAWDAEEAAAKCCFCRQNESETPPPAAETRDDRGAWLVRSVPNLFPSVDLSADRAGAFGAHEVIIESPEHRTDWVELTCAQLAAVLRMHRDRLRHWSQDPRMRHGLLFKNSGFAAGASLAHVHSQLMALPYVVDAVREELAAAAASHARSGGCLFCELLAKESESGERIVMQLGGFTACCAYAGRKPYETWVLPDCHEARFEQIGDAAVDRLAAILQRLLQALHERVPEPAYNL